MKNTYYRLAAAKIRMNRARFVHSAGLACPAYFVEPQKRICTIIVHCTI